MTLVPLLATLSFVPGIGYFKPVDLLVGEGSWGFDIVVGDGALVTERRSVQLSYELLDGLGRSLGSSDRRGLPFWTSPNVADPLLADVLTDMREGSERVVTLSGEKFPNGIGSLIPPRTDLKLRLRVLPRA